MNTLTKSCCPTIVITSSGEVPTHQEATVHVKELDLFLTMKVLDKHQRYYRSESFAMNTDTLTNGSTVKKNHISSRKGFEYDATRRTSVPSWFQACQRVRPSVLISQLQGHLQYRRVIFLHLLQDRLRHQQQHQVIMRLEEEDRIESDTSPVPVSTKVGNRTGQPVVNQANQTQKPKKRKPRWNKLPRCVPISQSGRKNPGNIWWMTEVLNTETHTRVLLMNYLWNLREVWIWAKQC